MRLMRLASVCGSNRTVPFAQKPHLDVENTCKIHSSNIKRELATLEVDGLFQKYPRAGSAARWAKHGFTPPALLVGHFSPRCRRYENSQAAARPFILHLHFFSGKMFLWPAVGNNYCSIVAMRLMRLASVCGSNRTVPFAQKPHLDVENTCKIHSSNIKRELATLEVDGLFQKYPTHSGDWQQNAAAVHSSKFMSKNATSKLKMLRSNSQE